jgi:RNA polymerase sigma factor (sigma-70 family)
MTLKEYNQCVDLYADKVYRFILKNIKDPEKSSDIVQDTFEIIWINVSEIDFSIARSYMFTTAYRLMIDQTRRENRQRKYEQQAKMEVISSDISYDVAEVLNKALEKLPEVQRSVLMLRDYEGYSYKEIGEITNLNEVQVKVYIFRARIFIKEYIGKIDILI